MSASELSIDTVFSIGPLAVTSTSLTSSAVVAAIGLLAFLGTRRLKVDDPGMLQSALEGLVTVMQQAVDEVVPVERQRIGVFVASLWCYLVVANLVGLIPGLHSPTRDLSATSALALLVFFSTHWFGIRSQGLGLYLRHYLSPTPLLLPFHIVSEITRTLALAVRLFGNIMSLEMAALLILVVAGFLAPVPILMLHIVEALVQAYIFGMLALIYIAGGIQTQIHRQSRKE
ncbi:F0F1 ATP synthase subunit A [Mangrovimicrobium sediminis]|uniref:ATP synthase subunit a n=1 Tax=Mangrovimicrobium sediminis TaxID=2562682 RepID=A0A4Z0LZ78_9GAMM|nr:F0F1 ATP synthase subunit A [Haliea sp. SAOS-164]TGD72581.1 F0F1 ATP synthase subunit A [Haliea sp. SAOS-164]